MTLAEISKIIEAEVITGKERLDTEVKIGCASDLMSDVLAFAKPDAILITGLATQQVIYTADVADINAICFIRGKQPDPQTVKLAAKKDMTLMATHLPMFVSCGRLFAGGLRGLGYLDINLKDGQR